jgi:hypothetical protein
VLLRVGALVASLRAPRARRFNIAFARLQDRPQLRDGEFTDRLGIAVAPREGVEGVLDGAYDTRTATFQPLQ